ncbi:nuclear transport factor 2 family protein [Microvirga roseola]|uniref:nuclear transport factor 2 family protein n=1 Tax=Microvirga roseola TaxID=2883126 RepID=UPI001E2829FC|nr:nuclear transport factor 2 family protein [Microvirga roseola]
MDMPDIVRAYFEADRRNDSDALAAAFSADAVVEDEGVRHEGVSAICTWWVAAKDKYHHVAEPIKTTGACDRVSVRAKVSGELPNSPATLDFFFTVKDDKIAALEIK